MPGLDILREATREYPITKIIWPALAIVAVLSIISGLNLGWSVAAFGAILILAILIVFQVVAYIATAAGAPGAAEYFKYPAIFLVWSFSLAVVACVALLMSCFFFHSPRSFGSLIAALNSETTETKVPPAATGPATTKTSLPPVADTGTSSKGTGPLNACLDQIDQRALSPAEVESRARECLRTTIQR